MSYKTDPTVKVSSAHGRGEVMKDAQRDHEPPPGVELKTDHAKNVWKHIMRQRAYKHWSPSDLLLAGMVVRLEMWLQRGRETLDRMIDEGADIFDPESYANEYNKEMMKVEIQLRTHLRSLGFTRTAVPGPENSNNNKKAVEDQTMEGIAAFAAAMGGKAGDKDSFLATQ